MGEEQATLPQPKTLGILSSVPPLSHIKYINYFLEKITEWWSVCYPDHYSIFLERFRNDVFSQQSNHLKLLREPVPILSSVSLTNRRDNQDSYWGLCAALEWLPLQTQVRSWAAVQPAISIPEQNCSWIQYSLPLAPTSAWHFPDTWPGVHFPAVPLQQLYNAGTWPFPYGEVFLQAKCWQGRYFLKLLVNQQRHKLWVE